MKDTIRMTVRTVFVLLLVTAVVAAVLAGVNAITKDRIAAINAEKTALALSAVLPDGADAAAADFTDDTGMVQEAYASPRGFALKVAPQGFGGPITMMVGVDKNGTVLGISVISLTESPGFGATAADKGEKGQHFRDQFAGMSGELSLQKFGGQVEAISGATISSKAITEGMNAAIACAERMG